MGILCETLQALECDFVRVFKKNRARRESLNNRSRTILLDDENGDYGKRALQKW
jgi:hypothetical protein